MHTLASAQQLPNMQLNSPLPVVLSPGKHFKSQDSRGLAGCPKQHCTHGQATSTFLQHGPFSESHLGGQEAEATANRGTTNWKTPFLADIFICPARKFSVSLTRSRHISSIPTINLILIKLCSNCLVSTHHGGPTKTGLLSHHVQQRWRQLPHHNSNFLLKPPQFTASHTDQPQKG